MYAYIEGDNLDEVWGFFHGTSVGFVSPKVGDNFKPPPPPPPPPQEFSLIQINYYKFVKTRKLIYTS